MAAHAKPVPANLEHLPRLFQLIQRYDIDDFLVAATHMTLQDSPMISSDEKRDIEKQGGSRREKLDRLITLVTKSAERMTRFAVFIKWYTSPIQEAADAVLESQNSLAAIDSMKISEMVTNSRAQNEKTLVHVADQRIQVIQLCVR
jgi:hypothetical protein